MKDITLEELTLATWGAEHVKRGENGVEFFRFSQEEIALYREKNLESALRAEAVSGVKLCFETDSPCLALSLFAERASSRSYFCVELFVNGERWDQLNNFDVQAPLPLLISTKHPLGDFSKTFSLPEGNNIVEIYFPWSVKICVKKLSLARDASFRPCQRRPYLLAYGDSITQGYDALYPSEKYVTRLARALSLEERNKAIGAEFFFGPLAEKSPIASPEIILVAYGTNDWSKKDYDSAFEQCSRFYRTLSLRYPQVPIFAITPLWRADWEAQKSFGSFERVFQMIEKATSSLDNVHLVNGFPLVDHDPALFGDLRLHPNSCGFRQYYERLHTAIRPYL